MSDVRVPAQRAAPDVKVELNVARYLEACAAKGCTSDVQRAHLLGITPKNDFNYRKGHHTPLLVTAKRMAWLLDVPTDDLWTTVPPEAAA